MDWFSFAAGCGFTIVIGSSVIIGLAVYGASLANYGESGYDDDDYREPDFHDPRDLNRVLQEESNKLRPFEDQFTNI